MSGSTDIDHYFELALDLPERKRAALLAKLAAEEPETAEAVIGLLRGQVRNADFVCRTGSGGKRDQRAPGVALGIDDRAAPDQLDGLHHLAVVVDDIPQAARWYREHFRCEVEYEDSTWAMLQFANVRLALMTPGQHPPHAAIARSDASAYGKLSEHRDGSRYVYITDPFGNTIEVIDSRSLPARPQS